MEPNAEFGGSINNSLVTPMIVLFLFLVFWNIALTLAIGTVKVREDGGQLDPKWLSSLYERTGDLEVKVYIHEKEHDGL